MNSDKYHQLEMLETLESDPEITQADLAAQVGVAVGTVNWYLKQWSQKGWLKIRRIGRWRWEYLLTPKGIAEKTRLAGKYLEHSMRMYRRTREQARNLLEEVLAAGYSEVTLDAEEEFADIFALTCLEMGFECLLDDANPSIPRVTHNAVCFELHLPPSDIE